MRTQTQSGIKPYQANIDTFMSACVPPPLINTDNASLADDNVGSCEEKLQWTDEAGVEHSGVTLIGPPIKMPHGAVSLVHELNLASAIGAEWNIGDHLSATFVNMRQDYRDDTMQMGDDPEDRIIMFQQPILYTGYVKTADVIGITVFGFEVLNSDRENTHAYKHACTHAYTRAYAHVYTNAYTQVLGSDREMIDSCKYPPTFLFDGGPMVEKFGGGFPEPQDTGARRLGVGQGVGVAQGHGVGWARGRHLAEAPEADTTTALCWPFEKALLDEYEVINWKLAYTQNLGPVVVSGSFTMTLVASVELTGSLCLLSQKVALAMVPTMKGDLSIAVSGEIPFVVRGGVAMDVNIFTLTLNPKFAASTKSALTIGFDLELVLVSPSFKVYAFIDRTKVKWCGEGAISLPCGFEWFTEKEWIFYEWEPDVKQLEKSLWSFYKVFDDSVPVAGSVEYSQHNATHLKVTLSGWMEHESTLDFMIVRVSAISIDQWDKVAPSPWRSHEGSGNHFFSGVVEYTDEYYFDLSKRAPPDMLSLEVSVEVCNTVKLCTSKEVRNPRGMWDASVPLITDMRLLDPVTGELRSPTAASCGWKNIDHPWDLLNQDAKEPRKLETCEVVMLTNAQHSYPVEVDVLDFSGNVTVAFWSISSSLPDTVVGFDVEGAAALTRAGFRDCGHADVLTQAHPDNHLANGPATISFDIGLVKAREVLVEGSTVYFHFWLCDSMNICGMRHSYPILVDRTLPPSPAWFYGDHLYNTSTDWYHHYFTSPDRIAPAWNTEGADWRQIKNGNGTFVEMYKHRPTSNPDSLMFVPITDKWFASVWHTWRVVQVLPDGQRLEVVAKRNASGLPDHFELEDSDDELENSGASRTPGGSSVPLGGYTAAVGISPYGTAQARKNEILIPLVLGGTYQVELASHSVNGMTRHSTSADIIADWTPAECVPPELAVPVGGHLVKAGAYPDGSSSWWGVRQFYWLGIATMADSVREQGRRRPTRRFWRFALCPSPPASLACTSHFHSHVLRARRLRLP